MGTFSFEFSYYSHYPLNRVRAVLSRIRFKRFRDSFVTVLSRIRFKFTQQHSLFSSCAQWSFFLCWHTSARVLPTRRNEGRPNIRHFFFLSAGPLAPTKFGPDLGYILYPNGGEDWLFCPKGNRPAKRHIHRENNVWIEIYKIGTHKSTKNGSLAHLWDHLSVIVSASVNIPKRVI